METREEQLSSSYEYILSLPKPRRVQVNAVIVIIIGSLPIASIFLIYSGVQTIRSAHQISTHTSLLNPAVFAFIFPVILIAISATIYWKLRRDTSLLRDEELAIGVVTHQKLIAVGGGRGGRRKQSRIRYRFKDPAGRLFQGTGTDHTRRLQVNMTVPGFFGTSWNFKTYKACCCDDPCEFVDTA